jgi:hypothetical protein
VGIKSRTLFKGDIELGISPKILNQRNYIFDVEKRKIVKQFDGKFTIWYSWMGNGDQIIVERNGKIEFEGIPE